MKKFNIPLCFQSRNIREEYRKISSFIDINRTGFSRINRNRSATTSKLHIAKCILYVPVYYYNIRYTYKYMHLLYTSI